MRKKQSFHEFCGIIRGYDLFTKSGVKVEKYQAYWGVYKIEDLILKDREDQRYFLYVCIINICGGFVDMENIFL